QHLRQKALKYGTPSTKIWDAPVGADISFFFPRPKNENLWRQLQVSSPLIVYSGQLEVASYAEFTLDILKTVRETIPTAHLLILGGGRKLPAIREKAKTLKIEPYVRFTNYVSGDKIPDYLSLADIALAPFEDNEVTRAKSPLKIVEYLAMGLPVVASHVGEAPIMIGEAGNTVPCGDIHGMAEKTVEILSSPDLKSKMNQKARIIAETTYNWKSHVDSLEKAYDYALRSFHS
ncbi:glycosyltransferase, partial [bacterium]|nr:glycosyltransferase [bacterium]